MTKMWNPLHFAVYCGHTLVVKEVLGAMKQNILKVGCKPCADNEGDLVNDDALLFED